MDGWITSIHIVLYLQLYVLRLSVFVSSLMDLHSAMVSVFPCLFYSDLRYWVVFLHTDRCVWVTVLTISSLCFSI